MRTNQVVPVRNVQTSSFVEGGWSRFEVCAGEVYLGTPLVVLPLLFYALTGSCKASMLVLLVVSIFSFSTIVLILKGILCGLFCVVSCIQNRHRTYKPLTIEDETGIICIIDSP